MALNAWLEGGLELVLKHCNSFAAVIRIETRTQKSTNAAQRSNHNCMYDVA